MKRLTIILLNGEICIDNNDIEIIKYNEKTLIEDIKKAKGKYIHFLKNYENTSTDYINTILEKTNEDFDSCFINYTIEVDGIICGKEERDLPEIKVKPYIGDYIWSFIFKKEKIIELINCEEKTKEKIEEIFSNCIGIKEVLYNHVHSTNNIIKNFIFVDEKKEIRRKNIFYLGTYCNGRFNGYISWLNNIGRCFTDNYDITIIYDAITDITKKRFERYFELIHREEDTLYIADRLFVTYSTYYYPKNILKLEENYLFIHGIMNDYKRSRKYKHDNYDKYIAVSKAAAEAADGYFPTNQIDYILNPIKIEQSEVKPHLKLVSALRYDPIKRCDRIHRISTILDEEKIPYTWNVFIDKKPYENEVYGGVVYRNSVINPLPFINDADYYVQLSDSEACCYSVMEAISLNTKLIVTPVKSHEELKVREAGGTIIPFEFFEEENKDLLRPIVLELYKNINNPAINTLDESIYQKYNELLKK